MNKLVEGVNAFCPKGHQTFIGLKEMFLGQWPCTVCECTYPGYKMRVTKRFVPSPPVRKSKEKPSREGQLVFDGWVEANKDPPFIVKYPSEDEYRWWRALGIDTK
jgi:hypothetical protein